MFYDITDDDLDEWIQFARQLIQKVVISPSPDDKSAALNHLLPYRKDTVQHSFTNLREY